MVFIFALYRCGTSKKGAMRRRETRWRSEERGGMGAKTHQLSDRDGVETCLTSHIMQIPEVSEGVVVIRKRHDFKYLTL